ncbi:MAG: endonuclease [Bacteroidota bacterium]
MSKKIMFLSALLSFSTLFGQINIQDARDNYSVGQTVTIVGVAADDGELGPIRYIQDTSGGLPAYGGTQIGNVNRGDSVMVTGELKDFNGLLEIDPISNITFEGTGNQIDPWEIPITSFGESYEGRLVQIDDVTFDDAGGTFAAGTNYVFTDGTNDGELRINANSNLVGTTIPSGAQTVVGLMSEYNGNYQILPRDVNDIFGYVAPDRKIEVDVDGTTFINGNTAQIGTATSTPIVLKNLGVNDLTISSVNITGPQAADFSTDITTGPINGGAQSNNTITFTPGGTGSRKAVLEINSDDPDNPNFIVNLYAIGTDDLATEPSAGASDLQFSNVNPYTLNVSFTGTSSAEKYIVLWKKGSAPSDAPADGSSYLRGDVIGDAKVAYVGENNTFVPRGIRANTDYYFTVYAFNGYDNYMNFNQADVIGGNVTSGGEEIGNYYAGISTDDATFVDDLTALINPHDFNSYFMYKTLVMDQFEVVDTTNGDGYIVGSYTGERKVFSGPFDWVATEYSREHTYAHSWMPTFPADGNPAELEYVDYHNLYPVNLPEANSQRSNYPLGVVETEFQSYLDGKFGEDALGDIVYEPRDEHKGNAARAIFYMAVAYNGANGTGDDWSIPSNQNEDILKEWHFADLPDNYEIARHELIYDLQDNRNPFIDSVDFACYIDFFQMEHEAAGCGLSVDQEVLENQLAVYPNPSKDVIYIQVNGFEVDRVIMQDMMGREVARHTSDKKYAILDVSGHPAGSYLLKVETEQGVVTKKVMVQ